MFSGYISNAHLTTKGNVFINDGETGTLLEVDENKSILWEYKIPLSNGFPVNQSSSNTNFLCFTAHRYSLLYMSETFKDLTPGEVIELNPQSDFCSVLNSEEGKVFSEITKKDSSLEISPRIDLKKVHVFSMNGTEQNILVNQSNDHTIIDVSKIHSGIYILHFEDKNGQRVNYTFVVY
jgi:zona occludens toxin (predicted ATPase)